MEDQPTTTTTTTTVLVCWKGDQTLSSSSEWDAGVVHGHPWLFVGSLSAAEYVFSSSAGKEKSLFDDDNLKVTRVLTVANNLPIENDTAASASKIQHLQVDLDDHPNADLWPILEPCVSFLDAAHADYQQHQLKSTSNNGDENVTPPVPAVLVHCASGISRSVAITLAWMLLRHQQPVVMLPELLQRVRHERPLASPNFGFWSQLEVLQKHVNAVASSHEHQPGSATMQNSQHPALTLAQQEWQAMKRQDRLAHVSKRRRLANEIHAQVDQLEVYIQQLRADSQLAPQTAVALKTQGAGLSDRLDQNASDTLGIPEDRVTRMIFKSARGKLERLMNLLEEEEDKAKSEEQA